MNTESEAQNSTQATISEATQAQASTSTGQYLYCIIHEPNTGIEWDLKGMNGGAVTSIHYRDLAIVSSVTPMVRYRLSRDNAISHELVIEKVMSKGYTVLPIRFGTIAKNSEVVKKKLLEGRYWEFEGLIKNLAGKREVGVRIFCDGKHLFDQVLKNNPQIVKLRDEIAKKPPNETHSDRVKIGKTVQEALTIQKKQHQEMFLESFKDLSIDHRLNDTLGDKMLFNGAFLIDSKNEADFSKRIEEVENKLGKDFQFKYVQLTPPFNFVNIVVHLEDE
jgi:hypothetical protein